VESKMDKSEVYLDMLFWSLPHIRNIATHNPLARLKDRSTYYESELVCQFHLLLKYKSFTKNDISFLNFRARWYYENCDKNKSILYPSQVKRISLLFAMVPEEMKGLLEWNGPCC